LSRKITANTSKAIGQFVCRDSTISLRTLSNKLSGNGINVHYSTIQHHMKRKNYKKAVTLATPMLTDSHKKRRVEWAKKHLNNDWSPGLKISGILLRPT